ncbi:MAG: lipoprotein [Alphaproteobacteria bacterium]|nr:lipoprotein [Alphaproteobacteria bacterium]
MKTLRWILLFAALASAFAACGRKSDLEHPPDSETIFPRTYPAK